MCIFKSNFNTSKPGIYRTIYMPIIRFTKTGSMHYPSTGHLIISKYQFHSEEITEGTLSNHSVLEPNNIYPTLEFNGRTILLKAITNRIFVTGHYRVEENGVVLAKMRTNRGYPDLILANGEKFVLKNTPQKIREIFQRPRKYTMLLANDKQTITYSFTEDITSDKQTAVTRYKLSEGTIESKTNETLVPLLGLFLVECLLRREENKWSQ